MIIFEIEGRNGKLKKKELIIIYGIICQKYCTCNIIFLEKLGRNGF